MRPDQIESLEKRAEELVDVFLAESDPGKWPGHGLEPHEMQSKDRGDRFWCKKDAAATLACAQRITTLVEIVRKPAGPGEVPDDLSREIAAAQKEAERLMDDAARTSAKALFDKRAHGKQ